MKSSVATHEMLQTVAETESPAVKFKVSKTRGVIKMKFKAAKRKTKKNSFQFSEPKGENASDNNIFAKIRNQEKTIEYTHNTSMQELSSTRS